jgi:beta-phosphoglucomutase-like phosphatase (HAD superfamily)
MISIIPLRCARGPAPLRKARVAARLGAAPEEALFADDSAKNVAGAERAGLSGHVYVDADTLAEIFRRFGLPP